jgi:endonuclease YncB( thermonuclease family)
MRRRTFLGALGTTAGVASLTDGLVETASAASQLSTLEFASTSSLLDANRDLLTDSSVVAVWAEDSAGNADSDGSGGVGYPDGRAIPLAASEGGVVGFGSMLVTDDANVQVGNEEFYLNVWDAETGGDATVLWDESHGQYYTLSRFSKFETYAEDNGYTVSATTNLSADLGGADAVVVSSPSTAFTQSELNDLQNFVANGGSLFLHDQSDYNGYDETANLNDIPATLGLSFRFNDDQVLDPFSNGGADYRPQTTEFDTSFPYFSDRAGLGIDPDATYTVPVDSVSDGDTVSVTIDGTQESIRVLGIDTPEKSANQSAERVQEWEGIESLDYLVTWGANATEFARAELSGETIDVTFDANEPVRDPFGRLLAYIHYDQNGNGSRDTLYNLEAVRKGYARLYDSSFAKHESFFDAEAVARGDGLNVWGQSDPGNSSEIRNRSVDDLFFPKAASVRTAGGAIDPGRVPVTAESTATQDLDGGVSYSEIPLVGVDSANSVAVVGAPLVDESYESSEGFAVDTSTYENYVFLTNLLNSLSGNVGDVLLDGGHGQFGATFGLSAEDTAYYMRFLKGVGIGLEGVNSITEANLSGARALVVTTPASAFTQSEIDAVGTYLSNGGAVVLVGTSLVSDAARGHLNDLAAGLGTDLRLNADRVRDGTNNMNGDSGIPTTTNFDTSFDLFSAVGSSGGGGDGSADVSIGTINYDAAGDDRTNLDDEYVVFENTGGAAADVTDWTVSDEAGKTYTFPTFTLDAGSSVTLHTGSGTDTSTDLYWGRGSPVWNNDGDTVTLRDDTGTVVAQQSYPTSSGSANLTVAQVNADAAGNDTNNLNDEYVVFENTGTAALDTTGYEVQDEAGKTYTFGSFTLDAGEQVTLHSGTGTDTSTDLYWGYTNTAVWNNSGDTVFVYDDAGSLVLEYPY